MKKTTLSIFGILALTTGLWATVPYTFTSNTPAKASEVNANFNSLSDKLNSMENDVGSCSDQAKENSDCDKGVFTYTYQHIPSEAGDEITIGGITYTVVVAPLLELGTGDHYAIKYLSQLGAGGGMAPDISIDSSYVQEGSSCYTSTFAGYPATNSRIKYSTSFSYRYGSTIYNRSSFSTKIKINQTVITIGGNSSVNSSQNNSDTDYDETDSVDWSKLNIDMTVVNNVRKILNYVEIVKIP